MKSYFKVLIIGLFIHSMTSCHNDIDVKDQKDDSTIELKSSMTSDDFFAACVDVKSQIGSISRATQLSELEAEAIMRPLVDDGIQLRDQIIEQVELDPSQDIDAAYFRDLSEEDCAGLSFVFHSIEASGGDVEIVTGTLDKVQSQSLTINNERLLHCAAVAVGYDAIKKIGVQGLITAASVRQVIIAIGKRYLGYVGLVLMVYEFVECIS